MIYVNHLFFMQGHCIFACIKLLDVILLLHLLAIEGNQHGRWMKKPQKIFCASVLLQTPYGPRREKTCLRGFRQSEIQTSLLSYRDELEN